MLKSVIVVSALIACCHCLNEAPLLAEDGRASKKKKTAMRLFALLLVFVFSKIAISKAAFFMFSYMIFQKLFYLAGIFLNYFMRQRAEKMPPAGAYGLPAAAPADYNTLGYSYGPPEGSTAGELGYPAPAQEYGLPALTDLGGNFNTWLYNKKP